MRFIIPLFLNHIHCIPKPYHEFYTLKKAKQRTTHTFFKGFITGIIFILGIHYLIP